MIVLKCAKCDTFALGLVCTALAERSKFSVHIIIGRVTGIAETNHISYVYLKTSATVNKVKTNRLVHLLCLDPPLFWLDNIFNISILQLSVCLFYNLVNCKANNGSIYKN
jgi:hypothetical protein